MSKSMSFPKMLGIFGGFVVLLIVIAVVLIKMNQKSPSVTQRPAASKIAKAREAQAAASAPVEQQVVFQPTPAAPPPPQPQPPVAMVPTAEVDRRFDGVETAVTSLDTRVTELENARKASAARASASQIKKRVSDKDRNLAELPGYKSLAVVGNRAWVATPDGVEDSVTKGDVVPKMRVRTMNVETGVVVTSTDHRIDPR